MVKNRNRKILKEVAVNNSKRLIAEDIPNYNKMAPIFSLERVRWTPTVGQLGTENKLRTESSS